jgi:hypothetical protein
MVQSRLHPDYTKLKYNIMSCYLYKYEYALVLLGR